MGFVTGVLKFFSGLLTAVFAIAGIGLAIYGGFSSYLILLSNSDMVIKDYGTIAPSAMTTIFGLILLIFVIVGCCGVCRESTCCMETYAAFLILLAMAHFALGGYCIVVYKNTVQRALRNQIENDLRMRLEDAKLDEIQKWMSCCGIRQPVEEYKHVDPNKMNGYELPPSCCESIIPCSMSSEDRYTEGCLTSVFDFTVGTNIIIGYISLGVGATELLAAIFGICLSCCIWRNNHFPLSGSFR